MASTAHWTGSWVSGPGDPPLLPGKSHSWVMWGYSYGDAISVSAHPVHRLGDPAVLEVEDVQMQVDDGGRRVFCTVRNVGSNFVRGYAIAFAIVGP